MARARIAGCRTPLTALGFVDFSKTHPTLWNGCSRGGGLLCCSAVPGVRVRARRVSEPLEVRGVRNGGVVEAERSERSARLFGLLALVVHRTSQDAAAILRREGLNPAQFQLLLAVRDRPGGAQREFGEHFGVTAGNVSMLVSKLTAAGFVRREAQGAANRIWLTEAGNDLVARLEPQQRAFLSDRFRALTGDELREMHRLAELTLQGLPPPS